MDFDAVKSQFNREGFAIIEDFCTEEEIQIMRSAMADIVDHFDPDEHRNIFKATEQDVEGVMTDYFMTSGDKIRFFFEDDAIDKITNQLVVDKRRALNKVGHALHYLCPAFRRLTFSVKVKELIKTLGMEDPVVCQSMYIFKQPAIGGREGLHGDRQMVKRVSPLPGTSGFEFLGTNFKFDDSSFVAHPVKKGSAILIHGEVVHKSESNRSDKSREIYTFHVYDEANCSFDPRNWLQPTSANTFCHLYDDRAPAI